MPVLETAPPPDMPKGWSNPKTKNTHFAYIADIKTAWAKADLTDEERRCILLRHGFDMTEKLIAHFVGFSQPTVSRRLYTGVGKIVAHLNGGEFIESANEDEEVAA